MVTVSPAEIADVRRRNLRGLIAKYEGGPNLAKALGHANPSFLSQLAGKIPRRQVTERIARDIEKQLDLPNGWLDDQNNVPKEGEPGYSEPTFKEIVDLWREAAGVTKGSHSLSKEVMQAFLLPNLKYEMEPIVKIEPQKFGGLTVQQIMDKLEAALKEAAIIPPYSKFMDMVSIATDYATAYNDLPPEFLARLVRLAGP